MFNPLAGLGNLQKLQQRAQKMQASLQKQDLTVEKNGVIVKIRGDQKILDVEIDGVMENRVAEAVNEAIKKTQELAAKQLMSMSEED
ncbi:MAG: YbaB/EbfC family nucleoid-associated protein [Weeksellaceae bacterium]